MVVVWEDCSAVFFVVSVLNQKFRWCFGFSIYDRWCLVSQFSVRAYRLGARVRCGFLSFRIRVYRLDARARWGDV